MHRESKQRRIEAPMNLQLARRKRGRENGALRRQSHLQWRRPEVYFEVSAENLEKGGDRDVGSGWMNRAGGGGDGNRKSSEINKLVDFFLGKRGMGNY